MQLSIKRENLLIPMQTIIGAVEKRQSMPIMSNALMRVKDNTLQMIATDMEIELHGFNKLEGGNTPGETTIPLRKLIDITRTLPEDNNLNLMLENQNLIISSGKSRFKLRCIGSEEFPSIEEGSYDVQFSIRQKDLLLLIERVYFAVAVKDVRYYLNGVFFEKLKGKLCAVATDGHRLALCCAHYELPDGDIRVIIPRKGVVELLRILERNDDLISVFVGENHFKIESGNYTFISKLIDGQYPDYSRVIPRNVLTTIQIERDILKQAMGRAAILSNEKYRGVKIGLRKNNFGVEAHNNAQEEAREDIPIDYEGPDIDVGFNVNYLLDALNILPSGVINMSFSSNGGPVLIEDRNAEQSLYVIMPMRL